MVAVSALPCSYSRAWSPSDDPTLFAWFDADSFSAATLAQAAQWTNKEGTTARHMLGGASGSTTNPQLCGSSDFLNGLAGVEFDQDSGEEDALETSGTVADLDDQPYTICYIIKDTHQNDIDYYIYFFEGSNIASFFQGSFNFGGVRLYGQSGGFQTSPPTSYNKSLTSDEITALSSGAMLTTVADGSNYQPFFNGTALDIRDISNLPVTPAQDPTTNAASLRVGTLATAGMNAILYEIVICIGTGADDNAKAIEGYLAHRYGRTLPDTHKYKKGQPWGLGIK